VLRAQESFRPLKQVPLARSTWCAPSRNITQLSLSGICAFVLAWPSLEGFPPDPLHRGDPRKGSVCFQATSFWPVLQLISITEIISGTVLNRFCAPSFILPHCLCLLLHIAYASIRQQRSSGKEGRKKQEQCIGFFEASDRRELLPGFCKGGCSRTCRDGRTLSG
jgi:hypothetical protein